MATKQLFFALCTAILFTSSCQKNGEPDIVLTYSELQVSWNYNPYPAKVFSVEVDGKLVADTLVFQSNKLEHTIATKTITGDNPFKKFVLKDVASGTVVLDTTVRISGLTRIKLLALSATDKPTIAGGGDEELSDPANRDSAKYSYIYNDPKLPDSVLVKFYVGNFDLFPEHDPVPFATTVLKRNEFGTYITYPFNAYDYPAFFFELYDAKSNDLIQGIDPDLFIGYSYGISNGNMTAPTTIKFTQVLIRYADPDEQDPFKQGRFYDQVLSETKW